MGRNTSVQLSMVGNPKTERPRLVMVGDGFLPEDKLDR